MGDALSWWKAHLRTQVGGDAFADTCTWVAFREIFYNRYFSASEQQRYEREYGSICQLDREKFTGEIQWKRLRLPPVTLNYCMRAEIRISGIEMVIGFRTGDRANRRTRVIMTRDFGVRISGFTGRNVKLTSPGSASVRGGSTKTCHPPHSLYYLWKASFPVVCYKATSGCFTLLAGLSSTYGEGLSPREADTLLVAL
ncbi:hypothetical protein Tco_0269062 [Tanacetum coccineum]